MLALIQNGLCMCRVQFIERELQLQKISEAGLMLISCEVPTLLPQEQQPLAMPLSASAPSIRRKKMCGVRKNMRKESNDT